MSFTCFASRCGIAERHCYCEGPDLHPLAAASDHDARPKGRQTGHTANATTRTTRTPLNSTKEIIGTAASAELRNRLNVEIDGLSSGDEAALWAHRRLVEKGKLHGADAHRVEQSFAAKIATFANHPDDGSNLSEGAPHSAGPRADSPKLQNGPQ